MTRLPARSALDRVRVTTPCNAAWEQMTGNDIVRFCEHCSKDVHDLSALTRRDAELLVLKSNGRLCVRYRRASDSKRIITKDQPAFQTLHKITRRAAPFAAGAFSAAVLIATSNINAYAQGQSNEPTVIEQNAVVESVPEPTLPLPGGTASVVGRVLDPNGAVIPGMQVTLTLNDRNAAQSQTTDDEGNFRFVNIGVGTYQLEVAAQSGFAGATINNINASEGKETPLDVTLQVGGEMVTVGGAIMISPVQEWIYHYDKRGNADATETVEVTDDESSDDAEVADSPASVTATQTEELHLAASSGERADLKRLLAGGVYVDAANEYGETALMFAMHDAKIVKMLLRGGANVHTQSRFGVTPLMYAMLNADEDVIKQLIERGAYVNHQDMDGRNALMFAAFDNHVEVMRLLLANGANVNLRDREGKTALRYALDAEREEAAALLRASGATE